MMENSHFTTVTNSTNNLLWELLRKQKLPEGFVVHTDFQTDGKGQTGNSWESENGKNLMFSILLYPNQVPFEYLFYLSQVASIGIKNVLSTIVDGISVKWPNDIYWHDKKLGGILIENSLQASSIKSVIGIGLNINQEVFRSNAPNPVSLQLITGQSYDRMKLLQEICESIMDIYHHSSPEAVRADYANCLYRKTGYHPYSTTNEKFEAKINSVHPDGLLELETKEGEIKTFYFKEVKFESE